MGKLSNSCVNIAELTFPGCFEGSSEAIGMKAKMEH